MASTEKDIARDMGSDIPYPSEKEPETSHTPRDVADGHGNSDQESLDQEAQAGVKGVQAAAAVWSKSHLILAYVIIWFIYFVTSIQEVVIRSLNPYVTSAFMLHSLTAATSIMANIIGGLSKIPLAKILDSWGRPQGMSLMLVIWVVGFIMMAACDNVQTYAAAQVFSSVGSQGVSYCLTVFISDTSALKNRALMLSFATSPYIITTWIGGPISQSVLEGPGWRWGFGIFTIFVPIVVAPLCILFFWNQKKAKKMGLLAPSRGPLTLSTIKQYCIDVDLIGIILLAGGMALFLLPFSLWSYQKDQWRSAMIICMIIFGGLLLIVFAIYEKFWAPVTFIPFNLLMDRTVFFGGLMFIFEFMNSMIWGSYFSSMLQVVWGLDVTEASYVSAIYRVGSCLFCLLVGFLIRWTGRFKWLAVYFSFPLMILGVGLMIKFRQPDAGIGYICMTQIFVAFAGGTTVICGELAMMAPSDHQHIAVILAMLNLFGSIGSAIGSTVSAAIWTSEFPKALAKYVPPEVNVVKVYSDITAQLSYEWGSPARNAIARAYGDAQQYMLITSVCMLVVAWGCSAMWRDIKIKDLKQVKGRVI
ncbi:Major facilitator superfamily domain general substrate transporter [Penicillium cf. griseofulvum]|uniref:Major facilitator superfamily domain general substrate transporter n=1 Tax=Penicillium cf. griseofulvum TaxID=2972120 RepID=A0A9W9IUW5_9EURO|nr:Major facilitator superfamily domain general substrate transporter [Penicillium cf. griseofulvum]KAJ5436635.1 Major facilitator superfamily domain general substrate transporter [Penicillium cf. griseofulvum]